VIVVILADRLHLERKDRLRDRLFPELVQRGDRADATWVRIRADDREIPVVVVVLRPIEADRIVVG
jgi:hypothetical protein